MSDCNLDHTANNPERYNPSSARSALCFQIHDTLKTMFACSQMGSNESFDSQLSVLEAHISYHKQTTRKGQ